MLLRLENVDRTHLVQVTSTKKCWLAFAMVQSLLVKELEQMKHVTFEVMIKMEGKLEI